MAYLSSAGLLLTQHMAVDRVTVRLLSAVKALLGKKVKACVKRRDKSTLTFRVHKVKWLQVRKQLLLTHRNDVK